MAEKVGRNEACPCGSGRKYKHCCLRKGQNDPYSKGAPAVPQPVAPQPAAPQPPAPQPAAPRVGRFRPTLRGAAFTPAAAAHVSRGGPLPGIEVHPWVVAQLRARTGIGPGGKPPRSTIASVRAMDTTALVGALARFGVQVDAATFAAAAEATLSAWDVSLDWTPFEGADPDFLGLAACELWRRWHAEEPSLEMIDEKMQDGYDALEAGDPRRACAIWLDVWELLLGTLPEADSVAELDAGFVAGLNRVGNWVGDVSIELLNLAREAPSLARRARDVYRVAAERLGDRRVRRDLVELHYTLGEPEAGEALLLALMREDPDDPGSYAVLSDHLAWPREGRAADIPRAIALLEQALARPVRDPEGWDLPDRLAELRKRSAKG